MVKLLIINVTQHTPQNRVTDTIMHVILNTINGVENCQRLVPLQKEGGDTWLDHKRSKLSRSGV